MIRRINEFLGTGGSAWLTVVCIRFAADFADSPWWFAWVAAACVFGLFALLMSAELVAMTVSQRS
jgi:hypothetical protein